MAIKKFKSSHTVTVEKDGKRRILYQTTSGVTGNPAHMESFHSDYKTTDQEIQENILKRIRTLGYMSGKKKTNESIVNSGTGSAIFNNDAHSVTTLNSKGKRTLFMQLSNETDAKKLAARMANQGGKYHPPGKWK